MAFYLDTSVLVAYYVPEALSERVQERLMAAQGVVVNELARLELVAALALRQRVGDLSATDAHNVLALFRHHWTQGLYGMLVPRGADYQRARGYVGRFDLPLKAPDALHLALADGRTLLTADRQLAQNAMKLRIATELLTP